MARTLLRSVFSVLVLAPGITVQQQQQQQPQQDARAVGFADLLRELVDLDRLCRAPLPGTRTVQFSSYDRHSDAGPADAGAWYANGDRGQYLRVEERDGRQQHVMVDAEGPGAVVRIWSANPSGKLYFYLDGEAEPRWMVDFAELTAGRMAPFLEPLCGVRARGANCHVPIPFQKHLVIASDAGDLYYQVNVRRFPDGTAVESFRPAQIEEQSAVLDGVRDRLRASGEDLAVVAGLQRRRGGGGFEPQGFAPTAGTLHTLRLTGPTTVRELRIRVRPKGEPDLLPEVLRRVMVRIAIDSEETVAVPVSDFFGAAPGFRPYAGFAVGVRPDGFGYCRFPMPVQQVFELRLDYDGLPVGVDYDYDLYHEPAPLDGTPLLFRCSWHQAKDLATRPRTDHLLLDATGTGRFVGCSLMVRNPTKAWWGEGDEKFFVDGEDFPSTFGTGTEDYFGYAWCCPETFSSPFHAQPQCDGPGNFGYTSVNRQQILDDVPFQQSFRFDLEVWHWQDVKVDYASTVWWYAKAGARSGLPPVPLGDERVPAPIAAPESFTAEGAFEGEVLRIVSATGGRTSVQEMGAYDDRWSGDRQLWWVEGKPGDELTLAVPVARAGRYRVTAVLTKARDYGIVEVLLAGRRLGQSIDLYDPDVVPTPVLPLGEVDLPAGEQRLVLKITGKNDAALESYMVGLDYLKLEPIGGR